MYAVKRAAIVAAAAMLLAGCGSSSTRTPATTPPEASTFSHKTELFIESSPEITGKLGHTFRDAFCRTPAESTVGFGYNCTATADDGAEWEFRAEITSPDGFTIQSGHPATTST